MDEFNILQLEKLGIIIELLGDAAFIKALNLEEIELIQKESKKHKNYFNCSPMQLRISAREILVIGRLIIAIAILKDFERKQNYAKNIKDLKKLHAESKILIGEWIIVFGSLLTLIGNNEAANLEDDEELV